MENLDHISYRLEASEADCYFPPRPEPREFRLPLEKLLNLSKKACSRDLQSLKYVYRSSAPYDFCNMRSRYNSAIVSLACLSCSARIFPFTPSHTSETCPSS